MFLEDYYGTQAIVSFVGFARSTHLCNVRMTWIGIKYRGSVLDNVEKKIMLTRYLSHVLGR